jgi:HlyD family type I secretion membrane fusion protein
MLATLRSWLLFPRDLDEAQAVRPVIRTGLLIIGVGILGLFGWVALAPLSGAVIAPGVVKVDTNRKVVQHQEGGIVKAILVRDGDRVQAGQRLIVLDDVQVDATLELVRTQLDAELARNARLGAERILAGKVDYPASLKTRATDVRVVELMARENALFAVRREALESQIALLRTQIAETRHEITARESQKKSDAEAVRLQREELTANEQLVSQGFVSKTRLLALQRAVVEYETRGGTNLAEMAQAHQRVSELELRALTLRNEYMQQAENELKESTARIFDLEERLRPYQDAATRQAIVSPVSGAVVDLKVTTVGAVIGPREHLMDIVPVNPELVVEAELRPEDINHVRVGSDADVRLTAFNQSITPVVQGKVVYVSADRLTDPTTKLGVYMAHVRIDPGSLAHAGNLSLLAGMPAEVHVRTAERTVFQYFMNPILGYLNRGMREP